MSGEGLPLLDAAGRELYGRVAPSLVDLEVAGKDDTLFRTLGVVVADKLVAAWIGLASGARGLPDLLAVTVRQGSRTWSGEVCSFRERWWTCAVSVAGDFGLSPICLRRSRSLEPDERVLAVGLGSSGREVVWGTLAEASYFPTGQPYDRSVVWLMLIEDPGCSHRAIAFDEAGRLVGLVESPPELPTLGSLLPGERLTGHVGRAFVEMLLELGEHGQIVGDSREHPERFVDAESLCVLGLAHKALGDVGGALDAWSRAAAKDSTNPWPHRARGEMLASVGRLAEASAALARASELEGGS